MSVSRSNKTQSDFITRTENDNTLLSIQSPLHGLVFCEIALLMRQFRDRCSFLHWLFATLRLRERLGQDGCQSAFWDCFVGRICRHVENASPKTIPQCTLVTISTRSLAQPRSGEL